MFPRHVQEVHLDSFRVNSRFFPNENISSKSQVKSSAARGIRKNIIEQYPEFEKYADELFPKKDNVIVAKW